MSIAAVSPVRARSRSPLIEDRLASGVLRVICVVAGPFVGSNPLSGAGYFKTASDFLSLRSIAAGVDLGVIARVVVGRGVPCGIGPDLDVTLCSSLTHPHQP